MNLTYTFNTPSGPMTFRGIYSVALTDDDDDAMGVADTSATHYAGELFEKIEHIAFQSTRVQILTKEGSNYLIDTNGEIREWSDESHDFVMIENATIELSDDHKYMRVNEL
jgi:hypothetical protein